MQYKLQPPWAAEYTFYKTYIIKANVNSKVKYFSMGIEFFTHKLLAPQEQGSPVKYFSMGIDFFTHKLLAPQEQGSPVKYFSTGIDFFILFILKFVIIL